MIADASDADTELVVSLGADIVVPRGAGFAAEVRKHYPNGVDGLADGSVQNDEVIDAIADGGAFIMTRACDRKDQGWKG